MRKAIGFLFLAAVVVGGVVFVERRLGQDEAAPRDRRSLSLLLGGGAAASEEAPPRPDNAAPPPPRPRRPPTASEPPPPEVYRHVVAAGEVLGEIVRGYLGTAAPDVLRRVARDSGIADPDRIRPGTLVIVRVPRWERVQVRQGETLRQFAARTLGSPRKILPLRRANPILAEFPADRPLDAGLSLYVPQPR